MRRTGLARLTAVLAIACPTAAPLVAAPLDLMAVSADAKWVMHVDMDAARDSTVLERTLAKAMKMHPGAGGMIDMAAKMSGMDPRKDLRDATAYGSDTDKKNGVLVVRGNANREFLTRMVEKAPDHRTMTHEGHTLHGWTHKRGRHGGTVVAAFFKDDVLVFSRTEEATKAALDVLDGRKASVPADSPLAGRVRPGSIVVARASAVDPDTKCPVLRKGEAFRVALGEHDRKSFYRARLEMNSAEAAAEVRDVVKGLASLASLRWGSDDSIMSLVKAVRMDVEGETCSISWEVPADDTWTVVEKAMTHWESRQNRWNNSCKSCGKTGCKGCGDGTCDKGCPMKKNSGDSADKPLGDDEF
ncbi:MAG: hypothetical protein K8S94_03100 [Planctomycetia bacterium]|nr:hypothetical protein [Planctomycetia bacterium]